MYEKNGTRAKFRSLPNMVLTPYTAVCPASFLIALNARDLSHESGIKPPRYSKLLCFVLHVASLTSFT